MFNFFSLIDFLLLVYTPDESWGNRMIFAFDDQTFISPVQNLRGSDIYSLFVVLCSSALLAWKLSHSHAPIGLRWTSSAMTHDSWEAIKCSPPETGCSKNLALIRWNIWRHEALRSRDFLEKKLFRRNRSDDWWSEFLPVYFSLWFPDNSLHRGMWFLVLLVAWITACKLMCSND